MNADSELILARDTEVTIIPAGDVTTLPAGTRAAISQALGGTVTIRANGGLFRLAASDWDALGEAARAELEQKAREAEVSQSTETFEESQVWDAMKGCYDPEIPVNIVDLGLIYDLSISDADSEGKHAVAVKMTLTAQGCGMGPVIADDAKKNIEKLAGVSGARVDIVWDPPWTPHMISEEGREKLGLE